MAEELILTNQEIKDWLTGLEQNFTEFNQNFQQKQNKIQDLLNIINSFLTILKSLQGITMASQATVRGFWSFSYNLIPEQESLFAEIMIFGAQLVFKIRSLLLDENIDYLLGGMVGDSLAEKVVTQDQVLSSMSANIKEEAVLLDRELESFNDQNKVNNAINQLWQRVQTLADFTNIGHLSGQHSKKVSVYSYTFTTASGTERRVNKQFYGNTQPDNNVYMRYVDGRKKAQKLGYYKKNNFYTFYNQGWLYQWFNDKIKNISTQVEMNKLMQSLNQGSISDFIQKMDHVPGYQGGDVWIKGLQYQLKFNNLKIISFNSIFNVLKHLQIILQKAQNEEEKNKEEIGKLLINLYVDKNSPKIQNYLTTVINNLFKI